MGTRAVSARAGARCPDRGRRTPLRRGCLRCCANIDEGFIPSCNDPDVLTTRYSVGSYDAVKRNARSWFRWKASSPASPPAAVLHAALGMAAKAGDGGERCGYRVHRRRRRLEVSSTGCIRR